MNGHDDQAKETAGAGFLFDQADDRKKLKLRHDLCVLSDKNTRTNMVVVWLVGQSSKNIANSLKPLLHGSGLGGSVGGVIEL